MRQDVYSRQIISIIISKPAESELSSTRTQVNVVSRGFRQYFAKYSAK